MKAPWSAGTAPATLVLPPGSVDCHHHIYDHRFPYAPDVSLRPPHADVAQYRQLQQRLGLQRSVVVQPSSYGTDNRCLLDALAQFGGRSRGIAVIDLQTTDTELRRMHEAGVRGIRFNLSRPAGAGMDLLAALADRIAPMGWHIQFHTLGGSYPAMEEALSRLPTTLVIDHLGRVPQPDSLHHPATGTLRRLVDQGRTWIKLSGAYHDSVDGAPGYADAGVLSRYWLQRAPERVVWGTDWPHPAAMVGEKPMPDDAQLLDLLGLWLPQENLLEQVMVGNPERLYDFQPTGATP
ncbi:amidohydrolase family protein [Xylophilus sp. GOD-11R]|uniref:amidohydrolase family protein n=1 Tax=Xylophilus sp. GOD-11R TaxID=3089814 RepID=UPI00298BC94E|nr:amidohydrolase family protein [Xylophilus sp. GOD-11R]WPB57173.1 amidohydrolase family protein [Xylophilus sp. GOD-11R]